MPGSFKTNPISLYELLKACADGEIQLPDFQRSWVWDDGRIRALIASISQAFPVGALMALETGGEVDFKPRPVQGALPIATHRTPTSLLLDGQQRMTSLFQTTLRGELVETVSARQKKVKRWYYLDIEACLESDVDREEAVIGANERRRYRHGDEETDLSSAELEYQNLMFPLQHVFDWDDWQDGFDEYWEKIDPEKKKVFRKFKREVLENFKGYDVPVITLDRQTSKEAVCIVFEKVNTGGKALDAFELVTAMYASDDFELRKDWFARQARLKQHKALVDVEGTEFLQAVSLLHTKAVRMAQDETVLDRRDLQPVSAQRPWLLKLPLQAYERYAPQVESGYVRAALFLHSQRVFRTFDLPYQSQLTPLAAILSQLSSAQWDNAEVRSMLARWYWNGVFGELYGSSAETRFAKDVVEVPLWLQGGPEPSTITDAAFRPDRLLSMRSRVSAAYKGLNALLMGAGAQDFRSGQAFDATVFFDQSVDIHHIFPKDWCERRTPPLVPAVYDSVVNKTPLSASTNRMIGGQAPSAYLGKLEAGSAEALPIAPGKIDGHLRSHHIDPALLRADDFAGFMKARQEALLGLIESAMGGGIRRDEDPDGPDADLEGEDALMAAQ